MSTADRRQQIIDTARTVFATRGFRGATTREIAAAAGITEAVIFQHFADKQALYDAILEQKADELSTDRWFEALEDARRTGDDAATLRVLYAGLVDQHRRDPVFLRLMVYASLEAHPVAPRLHARGRRLYDFVEAFIRDGQQRRRFRAGPVPVLVRAVLALPIYHILQRHLFQTPWPRVAHEDVIDEGVRFALAGLKALPSEQAS
ncbi:MAG TPA: TetR/AcrR family transcriptional regulator [Vicinamibacterales bacterium]|nr:TetR/AcrR family transcriptional regulator [Vicinamibacterales bacterium]